MKKKRRKRKPEISKSFLYSKNRIEAADIRGVIERMRTPGRRVE